MLSKALSPAILALILLADPGQAQSLARLGGPANLPPADFAGQQFVDARGCLFMRAGFGTNVTWVPRVDAGHTPICGYPPTFDPATLRAVEAAMAPDPEARAPDLAQAAPALAQSVARPAGGFWAALFGPAPRPAATPAATPLALATVPKPPKGYRLAWRDDRLNPQRGIGTPEGQAQQDLVWTRDIPAQLVPPQAAQPAGRVTVSTMSAPEAGIQALVQVGSFADPANASRAAAGLAALGLPVTSTQITQKGRLLTVVYAGPFAASAAAQAGLAAARQAGFTDAVLRMN
jgi:cell division protein FtsN